MGLNYKGYCIRTEVHPDESSHVSLMKSDANGELRRVIPNEEIFDFIWDIHLSAGHGKVASTTKAVKAALVHSVTEKDVKNFIACCSTCMGGGNRMRKEKGAKCPIRTWFFRQHSVVNLIGISSWGGKEGG